MRKLLFTAISLVLLAGCGTQTAGGQRAEDVAPSPTMLGSLPHVNSAFSQGEETSITLATELVVRRCMAAQGFRYYPFGTSDGQQAVTTYTGFGQTVKEAQKKGYGGDPRNIPGYNNALIQDANTRYEATLSAADGARYQRALAGNPNDYLQVHYPDGNTEGYPRSGCVTEAQNRLYGSAKAYAKYQVNNWYITHGAARTAEVDPRVIDTQKKWVDCVKQAGYAYPNQMAMRNAALDPYAHATGDLTKIREREIQMAVAAASCDEQSGTTATHNQVMQEVINENLKGHEGALAEAIRLKKVVLANTKKAIQGGG
ncbi:hypothetical protein Pth03_44510 [Planotetraspora thailandica]|uniref:Lipoprotein n=1 Tax=Planotetraspora thailandica TaxID=487172 RepID=A0A8J3XV20_9ACTN|nr:hypothetical protein [Planotetraspora thailandica]GII56062.1 hypothetical protein Pth03_44510 [Planotetraspora thailandica]